MTTPPAPDELEVSVFGPGYGECVVVHLGGGDWVVIDSCRSPGSEHSDALTYFEAIGVDVGTAVKRVFVSHWHDDHVRGISRVVATAQSASVCCSSAMSSKTFLEAFVRADNRAKRGEDTKVSELSAMFTALTSRASRPGKKSAGPRWVGAGLCFYRRQATDAIPSAEITVLSPSSGSTTLAFRELAAVTDGKRPTLMSANDTAMALHIRVGDQVILLGSDLETRRDPNQGWRAVLALDPPPEGLAGIYKVAHHGSQTAELAELWTKLLVEQPVSILSPFVLAGVVLPTEGDIERIVSRSSQTYLTSPPREAKLTKMDPMVERTMRESARRLAAWEPKFGRVTVRARNAEYHVHLAGAAFAVARGVSSSTAG